MDLLRRKEEDRGKPSGAPGPEPNGTIGKYRILERIGSGGFGTVFKAWDPDIKRPVAIKSCLLGKEFQARFFQEAELAGRLQHPNITTVYEFGMEGETPYIVQEFLSGEDLSQLIARREPLDVLARIKILLGIALGLEYAHRSGVMHRDIKPANVRILENKTVKIMDFGVAKLIGAPSVLTGTGVAVGSSAYMSPEQVCGDVVDVRTDIFSFGVLAYELFSHRKPFENENLFRLLEMIVKEEPEPIAKRVPDIPEAMAALIGRAMHKDPSERFESMRDLRVALAAAHHGDASTTFTGAVAAAVPDSETQRLAAVHRYAAAAPASAGELDDLARLAARLCGTPLALVSSIERDRQAFHARVGTSLAETPRELAFCAHAILGAGVMEVQDAAADARFVGNPLVTDAPHVRFYAGAPLVTPDGFAIGTLCVLDRRPRELSDEQKESLRVLARQVMAQLELARRRRLDEETSGERLLLEVAGLSEPAPPAVPPLTVRGPNE
ncbi:MAG TPA: protein kinase [Thermoanaerobaculia bacterium]